MESATSPLIATVERVLALFNRLPRDGVIVRIQTYFDPESDRREFDAM